MEALYRKYRPAQFSEIVGQEHIKRLLKNALEKRMISHAYIFAGPRGTGKTTTARLIAKSLNCEKHQFSEPCNECSSCKAVDSGSHLDVIELDAASNRGIDEIRRIRDGVNFSPAMGKYKVYIIDEVHMLTREAFNALLKTLEEPPEHVVFILATTNPEKIPPTITSRCQVLDFKNIQSEAIVNRLREISSIEGFDIDTEALLKIARKASGGLRDALSILEQVIRYTGGEVTVQAVDEALGLVDEVVIANFVNSILENDVHTVLNITEEVYIERGDYDTFLTQLIEYTLEKKTSFLTSLALEFFGIMKDLKFSEEKLLIAKLLFANLAEKFGSANATNPEAMPKDRKNSVKDGIKTTEHLEQNIGKNSHDEPVSSKKPPLDEFPRAQTKNQINEQMVEQVNKPENLPVNVEKNAKNILPTATMEVLEELKLNGDLSIFVGLSLATVYENEDSIRIVFDESKQFSYEVIRERKDEIAVLYKNKTGLNREVIVELSNEIQDPVVEKLKMLFGNLE
ncbi:MAG TPA: DNA polymerase III subunit gamma/tau [Fervidobacterium sp.]|nr:DNA polymerase III subunit gamma/tau [Fervidobacterium sp.]HOK87459.1 DNA polymerase III subunit gamma/tau [Fervidobacterium sp.]HOM73686.1 DNA polymerase III subunit gamma/tau [Fervidobacterium sp.]HRD20168.1 DNA polymerase III subunit gamma/tau [Fervidobacterium sp.]